MDASESALTLLYQHDRRSLITVVTLLTFALCGRALFSSSGSTTVPEGAVAALDVGLSQSRERSARGLAEQGIESKNVAPCACTVFAGVSVTPLQKSALLTALCLQIYWTGCLPHRRS